MTDERVYVASARGRDSVRLGQGGMQRSPGVQWFYVFMQNC